MAIAPDAADHVLDASAVAKLFLDEPESAAFRAWYLGEIAAGSRFAAPSLLAYEVAHLLARNFASPTTTPPWLAEQHARALTGIALDDGAAARSFAFTARLTGYDAAYLATAAATRATLVSYDRALLDEAQRHGIPTRSPR